MLIKSVLTAMPTYFLTVFKPPKWAITKIDRFRRGFFWKGHDLEGIRGGHCLVNWQTCLRPKRLGGLGLKNLELFSRALRLRWLWHHWDHIAKPWKNLMHIRDKADRELFFKSTYITLGNGKNMPFWEAKWLNGAAPKDLAPNLYNIARCKYALLP